ncbi:MAG: N-formylglutamate amidohydrolase [Rhodobacteraceae bacterium]|nr:N-formylglutamate amidohydrolase [Paracoccaceae bacterium]
MRSAPYLLTMPERRLTGVVFASPHSGRDYPAAFLRASLLDARALRSSEDAFVDTLLDGVTSLGAPLLAASAPRAWLDLNRAADELDPALIEGVRLSAYNPRVASGLGVIPRVVSAGRAIYSGKITRAEAEARIDSHWRPYHECLRGLMDGARRQFGAGILVDVHSMPHEAMDAVASARIRRPEVVIGDRFGTSAAPWITARVEEAFERAGLRTLRNTPFAGAYIAQTYGHPSRGFHALQIEIDRSLYMNERDVRPNGNFMGFRRTLQTVLSEIAGIGRDELPLAAE